MDTFEISKSQNEVQIEVFWKKRDYYNYIL